MLSMNDRVATIVSRCINKYDLTDNQLMNLLDYGGRVVEDNSNKVNRIHFIATVRDINTAPYITISLPLSEIESYVT